MTSIGSHNIQPHLDRTGIESLKPKQTRIIQRLLENRDVIGILPTGYGKSMTYIMMQLITNKTVIVISPLISLMKDQHRKLDEYGIKNVCFNSSNSALYSKDPLKKGEIEMVQKSDFTGLLYFSPESFMKYEYLIKFLIKQDRVGTITIDECHCITTWCDFRTSYSDLVNIKAWIGKKKIPVLALSATATEETITEIYKKLKLKSPVLVKTSFHKPQLSVSIVEKGGFEVDAYKISNWLKQHNCKTIVYCKTKNDTEKMAESLQKKGHRAQYYHAGIDSGKRDIIQDKFSGGELDVMTATIAFGMGVDISDIYMIIHYGLPKDIESYYQEIGRAGRDYNESTCIAMWSKKDFITNNYFVNNISDMELKRKQKIRCHHMSKMIDSDECRMKYMCKYFGETIDKCGKCDKCLETTKIKQETTMGIYAQLIITKTFMEMGHGCGLNTIVNIVVTGKVTAKTKKISTIRLLKKYNPSKLNTMMRTLLYDGYIEENTGTNKFMTFYTLTAKSLQFYRDYASRTKKAMACISNWVIRHNLKEIYKTKKVLKNVGIPSMFNIKPSQLDLKKKLLEWRFKKAKEMGIPPYCILSNKSIDEILDKKPPDMNSLMDIYGMGTKRCDKYGKDILDIVS